MSLYDVLGVTANAPQPVIDAAYRALARRHHPDQGGDAQRMQAINEAYNVLRTPDLRAAYNRTLADMAAPAPEYPQTPTPTPSAAIPIWLVAHPWKWLPGWLPAVLATIWVVAEIDEFTPPWAWILLLLAHVGPPLNAAATAAQVTRRKLVPIRLWVCAGLADLVTLSLAILCALGSPVMWLLVSNWIGWLSIRVWRFASKAARYADDD